MFSLTKARDTRTTRLKAYTVQDLNTLARLSGSLAFKLEKLVKYTRVWRV